MLTQCEDAVPEDLSIGRLSVIKARLNKNNSITNNFAL